MPPHLQKTLAVSPYKSESFFSFSVVTWRSEATNSAHAWRKLSIFTCANTTAQRFPWLQHPAAGIQLTLKAKPILRDRGPEVRLRGFTAICSPEVCWICALRIDLAQTSQIKRSEGQVEKTEFHQRVPEASQLSTFAFVCLLLQH